MYVYFQYLYFTIKEKENTLQKEILIYQLFS